MSAFANRVPRHLILSGLRLCAVVCCLALLAGPAGAAAPVKGEGGIVFTYRAPDAAAVFLAGDFNGWNATASPLAKGTGGLWSRAEALAAGVYEYKFIVDGAWVEDPDNPERKSDPFGGSNSMLTVAADGSVAGKAAAAAPVAGKTPAKPAGDVKAGAPRAVDGGVLFTFKDSGAGQVFVAGSFNGWNAADKALTSDGKGTWSVVVPLDAGSHQYKFVVDGNWITDPENGSTESDGYGGMNSLVVVDAQGQVTAAAAAPAAKTPAAGGTAATALNAKISLSGRYLTRFEMAKNIQSDPRYRLLRPSMSTDLNFAVQVNDVVDSYLRLRMDSNDNVILNNITSNLDEAQLHVHPGRFTVQAFWNQEIFTSGDPLNLVGNLDHPATLGHDHLRTGKGSAGAVVEADPFGLHFVGYFANVHNFDYYNDPRLFDNTGGDRLFARFSHRVGPLEIGVPLWFQREMMWFNFESLVGQPTTGIPALDTYLDETGDSSTWFETEAHDYKSGLDLTLPVPDRNMQFALQAMYVDIQQGLVTGNQAGQNNVNGSIEVPFLEREEVLAGLRWDWNPDPQASARVQHTYHNMTGATTDQREILLGFADQAVAENRVLFTIAPSPAQTILHRTEAEAAWRSGDRDLKVYAWHASLEEDYGEAGRLVPGTADRTSRTVGTWYLSGLVGKGDPDSRLGHGELEFAVTLQDPDIEGEDYQTYEFIGRVRRSVSRHVAALADVRYIKYDLKSNDPSTGDSVPFQDGFWAPFVGLEYTPVPNLTLVGGYGLDPVELSIDYQGRQFGRWWHRQQYLFDNPDAGMIDAEQNLEDARILTLRAQMTF